MYDLSMFFTLLMAKNYILSNASFHGIDTRLDIAKVDTMPTL